MDNAVDLNSACPCSITLQSVPTTRRNALAVATSEASLSEVNAASTPASKRKKVEHCGLCGNLPCDYSLTTYEPQ
jgi:hypothetical protein